MSDWQFLEEDGTTIDVGLSSGEFVCYKYSELLGWHITARYTKEVNYMKTATKRAVRTFLQLVAGGGLTALVTTVAGGLAPETTAVVMATNTVVVSYVQNLLEDLGWITPILK